MTEVYEYNIIGSGVFDVVALGIRQAAVAVVLQAAITLSKKIISSKFQIIIAFSAFLMFFTFNNYLIMVVIMILSGIASYTYKQESVYLSMELSNFTTFNTMKLLGFPSFLIFIGIYMFLLFLKILFGDDVMKINLMESFYRMGSLVIGGGHVIIPLIFSELIKNHLLTETQVLDGFAIISLMPGPMFNLAGYLGFLLNGFIAGLLSALAIFLPGMLLLFTGLGFLSFIQSNKQFQLCIRGISSASIGFIFVSVILMWIDTCITREANKLKYKFLSSLFNSLFVGLLWFLLEKYKMHVLLVFLISILWNCLIY